MLWLVRLESLLKTAIRVLLVMLVVSVIPATTALVGRLIPASSAEPDVMDLIAEPGMGFGYPAPAPEVRWWWNDPTGYFSQTNSHLPPAENVLAGVLEVIYSCMPDLTAVDQAYMCPVQDEHNRHNEEMQPAVQWLPVEEAHLDIIPLDRPVSVGELPTGRHASCTPFKRSFDATRMMHLGTSECLVDGVAYAVTFRLVLAPGDHQT